MSLFKFLFFGMFAITMLNTKSFSQENARVQIIHNVADAAAANVDVWLNETKLLENFAFRTATPFIDAPAGVEFTVSIQAPGSTSPENPIWSEKYTLAEGETYILVANGIVRASGYEPSKPFDIYVYNMGREEASTSSNTDILVHHGSTDTPTIQVVEAGVGYGRIIDNISYGEFEGYFELPTSDRYRLNLFEAVNGTFATYEVPLSSLGLNGDAITVVASGFFNPENNSNGEELSLWVALPTGGELIELPLVPQQNEFAKLQIIHNSADAAAAKVDVWIEDIRIEDFAFRTAIPFVEVTAGLATIAIQPTGSTSPENPIKSKEILLEDGESYVIVLNGIVSPDGYNPQEEFDIDVYSMGRDVAISENNTDVLVFHGASDAPTVDVVEVGAGAGTIVDDLSYGEFSDYLELPTADYVIEVRDETGEVTVAAYSAPLKTLNADGAAMTVFASGFLNPANNSNGPAFGLFAALADGTVIELPLANEEPTAYVQIIHNVADAAAAKVDIYVDGQLALDDFEFRQATEYLPFVAGVDFTVAIQPANSTSAENPLAEFTYNLEADGIYTIIATGIVSGEGYEPSPTFNLAVFAGSRIVADDPLNIDVLVYHGSTDAPTVDVVETLVGAGTVINDLSYGEFSEYLELPNADYVLEIRDETGEVTVAAYAAPLKTLNAQGAAITVFASGFLNPANNSDGPAFGLFAALADGTVIELPLANEEPTAYVQIIHNVADAAAAKVDIYVDGQLALDDFEFRQATEYLPFVAGVDFTVAIQPANSTSAENPLAEFTYNLEADGIYTIIATGIISGEGYEPSPSFNLAVFAGSRIVAADPLNIDVLVYHGSTDAPTVDVVETLVGAGTIINDLSYGEFSDYLELPNADYVLEIRDETGEVTVASYAAPLKTLNAQGAAITVFASGFLNPANNSDGPAFGLFAALADGTVIELPSIPTSVNNEAKFTNASVFPNPANDLANINISLNVSAEVVVDIVDVFGKTIRTNNIGYKNSGEQVISLDLSNLSNGVYMLRIKAGNSFENIKVNVIK
ncbi:MAG: DUF4397 domain-containing protein [Ignavibacteriae bacterium]|nr:DUF4397 domain-containing protein [Ignavibacteriota bacterium]